MSNKVIPISDFGEIVTGKTQSSNNPEDFGDETLFITPSDDFDHKYISTTARFLSSDGVEKLKSKLLPPESVLVTCIGSDMGKLAMNALPAITNQQINSIVVDKSKYDPSYVYYKLKKSYEVLRQYSTGSTAIPLLNKTDFSNIEITVEDNLSTQQKIAAVLTALDAKIELNQRINAELESMAKTLYDYWFVQTKKVGKLKVGKLGDFIEVNARSITKNYSHSEIEYIDIASVSTGRLEGTTKYEIKDAPSRARRLVKHGDTIWSTVRPNRKSYLFICNPSDNLVVSTGFAVLTPKNIPPSFLYFFTTTEKFVNYLVSNAEGSAYPAVSADRFAEIDFEIPHERKLVEFENIVSPVLTKISKNELESQTLTELRDWLLPMLMNGQVQVQT